MVARNIPWLHICASLSKIIQQLFTCLPWWEALQSALHLVPMKVSHEKKKKNSKYCCEYLCLWNTKRVCVLWQDLSVRRQGIPKVFVSLPLLNMCSHAYASLHEGKRERTFYTFSFYWWCTSSHSRRRKSGQAFKNKTPSHSPWILIYL